MTLHRFCKKSRHLSASHSTYDQLVAKNAAIAKWAPLLVDTCNVFARLGLADPALVEA